MYQPTTYTVESVTNGHPDKVCDQISDAILDACLAQDPKSRVAAEAFGGHGLLVLGGEITTKAHINPVEIARAIYKNIGYTDSLQIVSNIEKQSPDIAQGVDTGGAGDQGIMYGYATSESQEKLPFAQVLVNKLVQGLQRLRETNTLPWLRPDGKAQVTVENGNIKTILISTQHAGGVSQSEIREALIKHLIAPLVDIQGVEILVNPTGKFEQGGFFADTGLTGRKIMVDTYGGLAPHGGGAFSGKDPSKVDRSAAYMARFVAKNLVANGHAQKALVSVAYAIGKAEPLMVHAINERGENIAQELLQQFDFRPQAIKERLRLNNPIYTQTAAYGHFGKPGLPWEEIIKI